MCLKLNLAFKIKAFGVRQFVVVCWGFLGCFFVF